MLTNQPFAKVFGESVSVWEVPKHLKLLFLNLLCGHCKNVVDKLLHIDVQILIDLFLDESTGFVAVDVSSRDMANALNARAFMSELDEMVGPEGIDSESVVQPLCEVDTRCIVDDDFAFLGHVDQVLSLQSEIRSDDVAIDSYDSSRRPFVKVWDLLPTSIEASCVENSLSEPLF